MRRTLFLTLLLACSIAAARADGGTGLRLRQEWWPNGHLKKSATYLGDAYHGEYRTWTIDGKPYELRHFDRGRESGLQQSWDAEGKLYLNYVVRDGRRYGYVNSRPCQLPDDGEATDDRLQAADGR